MTVFTSNGTMRSTSPELFRDWIGRAIAMLIGAGLTRTDDTGQIDLATVINPTVSNTVKGFAVFRFSDAAQAAAPIFLRVDFGSGTSTSSIGLRIIVCKGTNGAGNPVGVLYTGLLGTPGNGSATEQPWRASAGDGYVALFPCAVTTGGSAGQPFFIVERSPDGTSVLVVEQASGTTGISSNSTSSPLVSVIAYDSATRTMGSPPVILPQTIAGAPLTGGTPLAAASLGPVFPWVLFPPGLAPWQARSALSYPGGDMPGAAFQVTLEGEERTYLPIPLTDAYHAFGFGIAGNYVSRYVGVAIRWE